MQSLERIRSWYRMQFSRGVLAVESTLGVVLLVEELLTSHYGLLGGVLMSSACCRALGRDGFGWLGS